jgi:hypothetical protein
METRATNAVETTLQNELLYNERIIQHPKFGAVRITRPTPGQEKLIAEARRGQTHKDMRDPDVLSNDQLERLAIEKGMWTADMSARITDLTQKTGEAMGLLESIGFQTFDAVLEDFQSTVKALLDSYEDNAPIAETVSRYFDLDEKPSVADRAAITDAAPGSQIDDLMDKGDHLRVQIDLLNEMFKVRKELNSLQEKQSRVFLDSLEKRSDRAEELATIYYCATLVDGGYLWPSYADIWNSRTEDVEFLLQEYHYFRHGITEEFRETLGKYGFIKRLTDTKASSADSHDQPGPSSDGESQEKAQSPSSPATESQPGPSTPT